MEAERWWLVPSEALLKAGQAGAGALPPPPRLLPLEACVLASSSGPRTRPHMLRPQGAGPVIRARRGRGPTMAILPSHSSPVLSEGWGPALGRARKQPWPVLLDGYSWKAWAVEVGCLWVAYQISKPSPISRGCRAPAKSTHHSPCGAGPAAHSGPERSCPRRTPKKAGGP